MRLVVAVVEGPAGGVLLFRRPEGSTLLAGTWELPWVEAGPEAGEPPGTDPAAGLAERYGGRWRLGPRVARVRHGITYRDIEVRRPPRRRSSRAASSRKGRRRAGSTPRGRGRLPLSSLVGKVLAALGREAGVG